MLLNVVCFFSLGVCGWNHDGVGHIETEVVIHAK